MPGDYLIGLDLGQARDYSALAVVERAREPHPDGGGRLVSRYAVRHLRRWPLGTSTRSETRQRSSARRRSGSACGSF